MKERKARVRVPTAPSVYQNTQLQTSAPSASQGTQAGVQPSMCPAGSTLAISSVPVSFAHSPNLLEGVGDFLVAQEIIVEDV